MESLFPTSIADSRSAAAPWYAPLLGPDRRQIEAIVRALPHGEASPREGLGGALVLLVARCYGTRRWNTASRVAIGVVESVDRRVHAPSADVPAQGWLRADAARLRRVWDLLSRNEPEAVDRVLDRLITGVGDRPLPEAVLFLRGAVAAGVLAGAVDDVTHARLDRLATGLGLALEDAYGALDDARFAGALAAVGMDGSGTRAPRDLARLALDDLPDGLLVDRMADALSRLPTRIADARGFRGFTPRPSPRGEVVASDAFERAMSGVLEGAPRPIARAVAYLQGQGGKRVRPAMVRAACRACGGTDADALAPAALLEWLHQSSLVIDDVLDEALIRRGRPTLHHCTDAPFSFGVAGYVLARTAIAARDLPRPLRDALYDAATTLADGQHAELVHTADDQMPLPVYYRVIEAKTARLFACAATLGARAAGASASQVAAVARFGREAGLGFQIVDDVLDFFGEEGQLGKRPGTDLRAGKVTLPILLLRDRLDPAGRDTLAAVLRSEPEARGAAFPWVLERMRALRIEADCLARARVHRDRAFDAITALPESEGKDALIALAGRLVERRA